MSFYVAGIDGGQSSTTAVIADATGRIIGRGRNGAADELGLGPDSSQLRDALAGALAHARRDARLPGATRFAAIVAGVSGFDGEVRGRTPALATERFVLLHDAPIAHAGALAGDAGVIAIAGTGSVVYGTGGTTPSLAGGWGYLFGDEGSAFWFAREMLATLMRGEDDGAADDAGRSAACSFFGLPSLRHVARHFYDGRISRAALAAFAPVAMDFREGRALADRGAVRLAELVAVAIANGAAPLVAGAGGMFGDDAFVRRFERSVQAAVPAARVVPPRYDASIGAVLLAYRAAGVERPPDIVAES